MDSVLPYLEQLIGFPSSLEAGGAEPVMSWVSETLTRLGGTVLYRGHGAAAALLARLGPAGAGGVAFAGHLDVVGVAGQTWAHDPFRLRREGERFYGRGTVDMKGFAACVLAALEELTPDALTQPVYLLFTGDEETSCRSAHSVAAALTREGLSPEGLIVGEPTGLAIMDRHVGVYDYRTTITGCACHAGRPALGRSAVVAGARLVGQLDEQAKSFMAAADPALGFDPPYSVVHVGTIAGGTSINTLPGDCTLEWECRPVRAEDLAAVNARVARWAADEVAAEALPSAPLTEETAVMPAFLPTADTRWARTVARALEQPDLLPVRAPFASEAGIYQAAGVATVLCGPGDIAQAHKPDESVTAADLAACLGMARHLCRGGA